MGQEGQKSQWVVGMEKLVARVDIGGSLLFCSTVELQRSTPCAVDETELPGLSQSLPVNGVNQLQSSIFLVHNFFSFYSCWFSRIYLQIPLDMAIIKEVFCNLPIKIWLRARQRSTTTKNYFDHTRQTCCVLCNLCEWITWWAAPVWPKFGPWKL